MSVFESALTYTALLFFLVIVLFYFYVTRNFNYWKKLGVPYAKPIPFFGNLKDVFLLKDFIGCLLKIFYDKYKNEPYVGLFALDKPVLLLKDPEIIKDVLQKYSHHFPDHNMGSDEGADPLWGYMIFSLKGQQWKHMRNKLSPTFTSGKMKLMFNLVNGCAKQLVQVLDKAEGSPVAIHELLACFTTDAIATCALGIESNSLREKESIVRRQMRTVFDFTYKKGLKGFLMFFTPELYRFLKIKFLEDGTEQFFRETVWNTIQHREQNGINRRDLVDSLMELRKEDLEGMHATDLKIDGDILVVQVLNIFLGGFETSSSALTFILYELSRHPEIQSKARDEIIQALKNNRELTYESLQEMKYLDMLFSEGLRKYPILGFLDRICNKELVVEDSSKKHRLKIEKGVSVYIPIQAIHNDPSIYPNPERFDPERFSEENKKTRSNMYYLPFGDGPRVCIGKRFAQMTVKIAISYILSQFEISPCKDTPTTIVFDPKSFVLRPLQTVPLVFNKIA